jgi:hypothetical protein
MFTYIRNLNLVFIVTALFTGASAKAGIVYDAAADFSASTNPNGA